MKQTVWTQIRPDKTWPDLDRNCLKPLGWLKEYFEGVHFELKQKVGGRQKGIK